MAYREDEDLKFLGEMDSKDLHDLVECLVKDKDGSTRMTEELTARDSYKTHYPKHAMYWREIAAEIQCFGANSFATVVRGGKGVPYREVLTDVCSKIGVKYDKKSKTQDIENALLIKILESTLEKMPETDREEFAKAVGISSLKTFTPAGITAAFLYAFKAGGFQSYKLTLIIANAVSRAILGEGLRFATNATLARSVSLLAGPVGWALTGVWTAVDIAGPAYRVTMPAVIQVALLRRKHAAELEGYKKQIDEELGGL